MQKFEIGEVVEIDDAHYPAGTTGLVIGTTPNTQQDETTYQVWLQLDGKAWKEDFNEYELLRADEDDSGCCGCGCSTEAQPVPLKPAVSTVKERLATLAEWDSRSSLPHNIYTGALDLIHELEGSRKQAEAAAEEIAGNFLKQEIIVDSLRGEIADLEEEIKDLTEELDALQDEVDKQDNNAYMRTQVAATILSGLLASGENPTEIEIGASILLTDQLLRRLQETK